MMEANTGHEFENSAEHVGEKLHILYDERKYCVKVWCPGGYVGFGCYLIIHSKLA